MCRYAGTNYKRHDACFRCRKMFRQPSALDLPEARHPAPGETRIVRCPECRGVMHDLGLDFKAPKQEDIEQWKKVEILFHHGVVYHSCGCDGPGPRPARLRDVAAFLDERRSRSEGERLLQSISRTVAARKCKKRRSPAGQTTGEHRLAADADRLRQPTPAAATAASLLRKRRAGAKRR